MPALVDWGTLSRSSSDAIKTEEAHIDAALAVALLFSVVVLPPLVGVRTMYTNCWVAFTVAAHVLASEAALGIATSMGITIMVGWYTLRVFDRSAFTAILNGWLGVWASSPVLGVAARAGDLVLHLTIPMLLVAWYLPLVRVWMSVPALISSRLWSHFVVGGGVFPKADHIYRFSPPRSQHFWNAAYKMELMLNLLVPLFCVLAHQRSFWVYAATALAGAILFCLKMIRSLSLPKLQRNAKTIMSRLLSSGGMRSNVDFVVRDNSFWLDWMSEGLVAIGETQEMYRSWSARFVALAARMFNYPPSSMGLVIGSVSEQFDLCAEFRQAYMDRYFHQGFGIWNADTTSITEAQANKLANLDQLLDIRAGHTILDVSIGSWGGVGCYLAEKHPDATVVCILSSIQEFARSRKFARELGVFDRMEFVLAETPARLLTTLSGFRASKFDRITLCGVVETIPDMQRTRFLRTMKRIQTANGTTLLEFSACTAAHMMTFAWTNKYVHSTYSCYAMTLPSLRRLSNETGFTIRDIVGYSDHFERTFIEWNRRFQAECANDSLAQSDPLVSLPESFKPPIYPFFNRMGSNVLDGDADGVWETHVDEASGSTYYYNQHTGESSWEVPGGFKSPSKQEQSKQKPPKWRKFVDDESGAEYYYDQVNGVSRWEKPEGFKEGQEDAEQQKQEEEDEAPGKQKTQELKPKEKTQDQSDDAKAGGDEQTKAAEENAAESDDADAATSATAAVTQWTKFMDASSGKPYYHNASTGTTQWEKPEDFHVAAAPEVRAGPQVSAEYQAHLNQKHTEHLTRVTQQVLDPSGNLSKLNAILNGIDGGTPAKVSADEKSGDTESRTAKAEWQQHIDPQTQRYYYHNVVSGVTQWNKPDAPVVSGLADWIPPEVPETDENGTGRKVVSGVNYVAQAKFNRLTGKYEQLGGDDYWRNAGVATDRAGRQMSHYFDMSDFEKNREEARRKKEQLKRKNIDWKKIAAEKKAKKQKQRNEWLFND
ncbi:hypothetical protein PHYBOEH_009514 [Phytophthora boehmeriae]|uniref:WW domain-containing protein n=1 Tax=Phytophthora boehmeriae TaxID=109152 RepID=A0A8T1X985_9STRA|nr:hypothetical protein PHYBOEH_009514 [Phytophthora boehmeriae]